MKTFIVSLLLLLVPSVGFSQEIALFKDGWINAMVTACSKEKTNHDVSKCLNERIDLLEQRELQNYFWTKMNALLAREEIKSFEPALLKKLHEMYPVRIPLEDPTGNPLECIKYSSNESKRQENVREAANALLQSALFAVRFATEAMGTPFSPILKFRAIEVCEGTGRLMKLNTVDRVLEIQYRADPGFSSARKFVGNLRDFSAMVLWDEWQNGEAVNPQLSTTRLVMHATHIKELTAEEKKAYALYSNWIYLNPTGLRRILRFAAWKAMDHLTQSLTGKAGVKFLDDQIAALPDRFKKSAILTGDKKNLAELVKVHLKHPDFVQAAVAAHAGASSGSCTASAEIATARELWSVIGVANAKNGNVNVDFNFPFGIYNEVTKQVYSTPDKECAEAAVRNADKQYSLILFNGIDNGNVVVLGLSRLTDALTLMPQVVLAQIIQDFEK